MLIVSTTVNIISAIIIFLIFVHSLQMKMQMQQMYNGLSTMLNKTFAMEQLLAKVGNGFTEFIRLTDDMMAQMNYGKMGPLYKTTDGKYSARSIDELMRKIKEDGSSDEYFNEDELNKLKNMFESEDDEQDEEDL
jgi:hypothetical protein